MTISMRQRAAALTLCLSVALAGCAGSGGSRGTGPIRANDGSVCGRATVLVCQDKNASRLGKMRMVNDRFCECQHVRSALPLAAAGG